MLYILQVVSVFFVGLCINSQTLAADRVCSYYITQVAKESGVPQIILMSIAYTESKLQLINKRTKQTKISPWPWSLNIQGKSVACQSKAVALREIQTNLEQGITNIDCGCMQVNFRWHGKAFRNLEDILDPLMNIRYAALLLLKNRLAYGSWAKAIAAYHSTNKERGRDYLKKIRKALREKDFL